MTDDINNPKDVDNNQESDAPEDTQESAPTQDNPSEESQESVPAEENQESVSAEEPAADLNLEEDMGYTPPEDTQDAGMKDDQPDLEYKPQTPSSQEFGSSPMSGGTESLMSFVKNQKAVAIIGGLLFLYIVMNLFSSSEDEDDNGIVVSDDIPAMEQHSEAPQATAEPTKSVSIFDSIDDMAEEGNKTSEELDRLKSQVASLNRQNVDMRNRMDKVDQQLNKLTTAVEKSNMQLSALVKTQEKDKTQEKKEVLQEYRIRAIISGRAWLEDGEGNNVTVKVGDNIPTYGRVTKIKPIEGIVETSTGRMITFSRNE